FQLEMEPALGARPPEIGPPGRSVDRRHEAGVAATAARARDRQHPLARPRQIAEHLVRLAIRDDGAQRNPQDEVVAARTVTIRPLAVVAARGRVVTLVVEME